MIATELTFAGRTSEGAFKYVATIFSDTTPAWSGWYKITGTAV